MRPDPIFATDPRDVLNRTLNNLSKPAYQREPEWLREDIAGLSEDIASCESRIAAIRTEIPALERELLTKQRDLAEFKLSRYEKQAELAAKTGGAA